MDTTWKDILVEIEGAIFKIRNFLERGNKTPILFCAGACGQKAYALLQKNNIDIPFFVDHNQRKDDLVSKYGYRGEIFTIE